MSTMQSGSPACSRSRSREVARVPRPVEAGHLRRHGDRHVRPEWPGCSAALHPDPPHRDPATTSPVGSTERPPPFASIRRSQACSNPSISARSRSGSRISKRGRSCSEARSRSAAMPTDCSCLQPDYRPERWRRACRPSGSVSDSADRSTSLHRARWRSTPRPRCRLG